VVDQDVVEGVRENDQVVGPQPMVELELDRPLARKLLNTLLEKRRLAALPPELDNVIDKLRETLK
jgi:hypothetical protein